MKLLSIPNLSASKTVEFEFPLEMGAPATRHATKNAFIAWGQQRDTEWHYITGYQAENPGLRVNASNPAHKMRALVLDYDCGHLSPGWTWEVALQECENVPTIKPTYIYQTYSGGFRVIWEFDRAVLVHHQVWKKAIRQLIKELKADKMFTNLDEACWTDERIYYAVYGPGLQVGVPMPSDRLYSHVVNYSNSVKWTKASNDIPIPIEIIAKKVEEKWPGRWQGDFILGARGIRFWDESADNHTGAIVRETGMQCWTGTDAFKPWRTLFGDSFVKQFQNEELAQIMQEEIYFDGDKYWREIAGVWRSISRTDIILHLKCEGVSTEKAGADELSMLDKVLNTIQNERRVAGVGPLFHQKTGLTQLNGDRFLNNSTVKLIQPAEDQGPLEWGEGFPRLANFYRGWFSEDEQLGHYLAWVQRFYKSCLDLKPNSGQVVFIVGDAEKGKTFSTTSILAKLFGRFADASEYLLKETQYNGNLVKSPIWSVDDTSPGESNKHAVYSSMVKRTAANPHITMNEKFEPACTVPWCGRLVITCNEDPESLKIFPDLTTTIKDKIMIFKLSKRAEFDFHALERTLEDELPYFGRWLLQWDSVADGVSDYSRYGVVGFWHPDIVDAVREVSPLVHFRDLLIMFLDERVKENHWIGNSTQLLAAMLEGGSNLSSTAELAKKLVPAMVGKNLNKLKSQGWQISQRTLHGRSVWEIKKNLQLAKSSYTEY